MPPKNLILWNAPGNFQPIVSQENGETVIRSDGLEFHCRDEHDLKQARQTLDYLRFNKMYYKIPPEQYQNAIGQWFTNLMGMPMDWENPRTFQEKIQWLKLYDTTPLKTLCVDKLLVKQYVAQKIGMEYVNPLLGVWDSPDDIDLSSLPNQFVLKCNHGCGMNIIVKDKNDFDFARAKEKLRAWLMVDYGMFAFEFHYSKVQRKIIAEEYIDAQTRGLLPDYKFHCFNGEPVYCRYVFDRYGADDHADFFTMDWEVAPFRGLDHRQFDRPIPKPKNFELMREIAQKLAEPFSLVRVDLFAVDGKIHFGELTFMTYGGLIKFDPPEWSVKLGDMLKLPPKGKPFNRFEV